MRSVVSVAIPSLSKPAETANRQPGAKTVEKLQTRCGSCNLRELCLPCGLSGRDALLAEDLIYTRKQVLRGGSLYRTGDPFTSLYALRRGFFKATLIAHDGRDQVTAFHMGGEMLGMDGIGGGLHGTSATALEDSEVCVIPYVRLQQLARDLPLLQTQFHKAMSREITRERGAAPGNVPA